MSRINLPGTSLGRQIRTSPGSQIGTFQDGQIGSLGDVLGTLEGDDIGTSLGPIFADWNYTIFAVVIEKEVRTSGKNGKEITKIRF